MQKGYSLQFSCQNCQNPIHFSVFDLKEKPLCCLECQTLYDFSDEKLNRQIVKFENLCKQIRASEEILSNTSVVGINIGDKEITIPYRILLARLNSSLNLQMGDRSLSITFRIEPAEEAPH